MQYQTPDQGHRVELTWQQASLVHRVSPLRLSHVISEDAAEFVPAIGANVIVDAPLPMPPYELPDDPSG